MPLPAIEIAPTYQPLLTLDCSSDWCTLALYVDDQLHSFNEPLKRAHSSRVLLEIETLQSAAGRRSHQFGAIGVVVGPGSFTGVRIAVATAQAFAFANDCPVVRIDALALLARSRQWHEEALSEEQTLNGQLVVVSRRSRAELYYFGVYRLQRGRCERLGDLVLLDARADFYEWLAAIARAPWVGWGEQPAWLADVPFEPVNPRGDALVSLTAAELAAGRGVAAADAVPLYLNADSPWRSSR